MQRRFILGLGTQKAGTTWLSDYIRADPAFVHGPVVNKELHVWDHLDLSIYGEDRRVWKKGASTNARYLYAMEKVPALYFAYFRWLLRKGGFAADISPSYNGLSAERLAMIDRNFARLGVEVRSILLLRDPVSRCVSAFNMMAGKREEIPQKKRRPIDHEEVFLKRIESEGNRIRTDYTHILTAADQALDPARTSIMFYETLFRPDSIAAMSQFLGVGYYPERATVRSNEAKVRADLPESALRACAQLYRPTYEAVAARYPQVETLWSGFKYLR